MFDTMRAARCIRQARIKKNMTQMSLADAMGVSFQAVSNWERGNSLPDIGKLAELCSVLELTVDELLGAKSRTAQAVTKGVEKKELTMEELTEVAPMLPPEEIKEQTQKKKLRFSQIVGMAPFLDAEYLAELVEEAEVEDLSDVVVIAPFLSRDALDRTISRCESAGDFGTIVSLAPFLSRDTLDRLAADLKPADLSQMIALAPFLSRDALGKLVMQCEGADTLDYGTIVGLAPFLSKEMLRKIADRFLER